MRSGSTPTMPTPCDDQVTHDLGHETLVPHVVHGELSGLAGLDAQHASAAFDQRHDHARVAQHAQPQALARGLTGTSTPPAVCAP